jgi:ketosteroid isomerase-like protein
MAKVLMLLCSMFLLADTPEAKSEKEVLAAMNAWKHAMLLRDRAALEALYAPGLLYVHSSGKQESKAEAIAAAVAGKDRCESIDLEDISVSVYGDTAIVKAKVIMRINSDSSSGTATNTISLDVLHVWIKMPAGWQMAARHATRLNPT